MSIPSEAGLFRLHQAHTKDAVRLRYARGVPSRPAHHPDPRHVLANDVERHVCGVLRSLGYRVERQGHNSRYDLLIDGTLRVEVKAARWHSNGTRGRYQALYHNRADLVIFCPVNGKVNHFIIPSGAMAETVNLAVWSHDPGMYAGKWAPWFERWDVINDALADLPTRWTQGQLI